MMRRCHRLLLAPLRHQPPCSSLTRLPTCSGGPGLLRPTRPALFSIPPQILRALVGIATAAGVVLISSFAVAYERERERMEMEQAMGVDPHRAAAAGGGKGSMTPDEALSILGVNGGGSGGKPDAWDRVLSDPRLKIKVDLGDMARTLQEEDKVFAAAHPSGSDDGEDGDAAACTQDNTYVTDEGLVLPLLARHPRQRERACLNFQNIFTSAKEEKHDFLAGKASAAYRICVDPLWDAKTPGGRESGDTKFRTSSLLTDPTTTKEKE